MAITSGIFNSINGDRKYNAPWFASYFASFIGNGVFPNPSSNLQTVEGTNMQTIVKAGKGWIDGYYIVNDANFVLTHDVADGVLKRIDRVVMRLNYLTRQIEIVIKKGTFASNPVAPVLQRDADYYELALADVFIANGATQITQAQITDTRLNTALCGIVHGTVDQVDTTTIFNQYESWFEQYSAQKAIDINEFQRAQEQEFLDWFASLRYILDGDVAGNLLNLINRHEVNSVRHNNYGTATGINNLNITLSPAPETLTAGFTLRFKNITSNTGAVTLNVNGLGVKSVIKSGGTALSSGNLKANGVYTVCYDGNSFILQGEGGEYGNALASDVRSTKTLGTENGVIPGSLDLANLIATNLRNGVTIDNITGILKEKKLASGIATPLEFGDGSVILEINGLSFKPSLALAIRANNTNLVYFRSESTFGAVWQLDNNLGYAEENRFMQGGFSLRWATAPSTTPHYWLAIE